MGSHWNKVIAGVVALCIVVLLLGGVMALLLYQTAASKDEVLLDEAQDLYRVQALNATSQRAAYLMRGPRSSSGSSSASSPMICAVPWRPSC